MFLAQRPPAWHRGLRSMLARIATGERVLLPAGAIGHIASSLQDRGQATELALRQGLTPVVDEA
jgi:hypothetical protein